MEVVITWCVGIRVVRLISAGSVLDRGNLTDHHGMCVLIMHDTGSQSATNDLPSNKI